ncbi:hypothetical protein EST38_g11420 [Candolleomyces aberdarensis]|uniref:Uncharacterized protein n=1 Tax=Candolleomyces aberdarensis TaxID=2316362 RepID=A0A4Q2D4W8_9AGAR|nr:hypothetical protein EST38_g11420 [Candolleomyces aberdarensis]
MSKHLERRKLKPKSVHLREPHLVVVRLALNQIPTRLWLRLQNHAQAVTYPPAAAPSLQKSIYAPGGNLGPTPAFNFPVYMPQSGAPLHAAHFAMFPQQHAQGQVAPFVFGSRSYDAGGTAQGLQQTAPTQPSHTVAAHSTQLVPSVQLAALVHLAPSKPMVEDEPQGIQTQEDQVAEQHEAGGQPIYVPPGEAMPDKRLWPSDKAHPFGYIDGLARGSEPIEWARQRKKGGPIIKQEYVSKSWEYWAQELFTRAERMADAVSGWVYVAIQQPGSRGPFVHFASRRVRKEAPDELAAVHNQVARMMAILKRGDRAQNLDLIRENEKVKDQAESAEKRAFEAESELTRLRAELNARNHLLSMMYHKVQGLSDASDLASVE